MLKRLIVFLGFIPSFAHGAKLLSTFNNFRLIRMAQDGFLGSGFLIKNIVFHCQFFSIFIRMLGFIAIIFVSFFQSLANHVIADIFLLFSHAVPNVFYSAIIIGMLKLFLLRLLFFGLFGLFSLFGHRFCLLCVFIRMFQKQKLLCFIAVNDGFIFELIHFIAMSEHYVVDLCAFISSGENNAQFPDNAMKHIAAILFQLIGINGKGFNVLISDKFFSGFSLRTIIEIAFGPNAAFFIVKHRMAQNQLGVIVKVLPNKRNSLAILISKRVFHNGTAIRAFNAGSRRPSGKIRFSVSHMVSLPNWCYFDHFRYPHYAAPYPDPGAAYSYCSTHLQAAN